MRGGRQRLARLRPAVATVAAILGAGLTAVNLVGLTMDYTVPPGAIPRAASADPDPGAAHAHGRRGRDGLLPAAATAVHQRMVHWGSQQHGGEDPVAAWDNWILAAAGAIAWPNRVPALLLVVGGTWALLHLRHRGTDAAVGG